MLLSSIFLILGIISIQDLRYYEVQDRYFLLLFLLVCIYGFPFSKITLFVAFAFCLITILFFLFKMLGGADVKLYFISCLFLDVYPFLLSVFYASFFACLFCVCLKQKKIPFIPCMSLGIFLSFFVTLTIF